MPSYKGKLELTLTGKETPSKLEPRILIEDQEKSNHAAKKVTDNNILDNRLVFGDNLLEFKSFGNTRNQKRHELFDAQDAIDKQRDDLIKNIEKQLKQQRSVQTLFAVRWTVQ